MKMSFRWYGATDPVPLEYIRQIPGMHGIVSAVYDVPAGEVWPVDHIARLKQTIENHGLKFEVIESVPVHEEIKMGLDSRRTLVDNYCRTVRHLGACGLKVICYNFMPVFDWTRTILDRKMDDGSTTLAYDQAAIEKMDPKGLSLPGWDASYKPGELEGLLARYAGISEERLWDNFEYFLKRVIPAAEEAGIKMAVHPDDPPRPILGLPRIVKDRADLERLTAVVPSPANGLTLCSGSLGADMGNDVAGLVREFAGRGLIHFAHMRNVLVNEAGDFCETAHLSSAGSLDMAAIIREYYLAGFDGYMRPDHGRMIWGETGKPGYGLYDRALGATYLNGLWEGVAKCCGKGDRP